VVDIPLSRSDYFRGVAKEARIRTKNRYFEQNPVLNDGQASLLARMGMKRFLEVGDGPIRGIYSQQGSFENSLFVASGDSLWRVSTAGVKTFIGIIPQNSTTSAVSMVATSNIGETPAFLFVASGSTLMCYTENGFATGSISGVPVNNDVVQVGTIYYRFTNSGVNTGVPSGTLANPWLVALGISAQIAWQNLAGAFGATGVAGTEYTTALTANTSITVSNVTASAVFVRATAIGTSGNTIATTETGAAIAWSNGVTLINGGGLSWTPVETPDDVGVISLGYSASYVVVVPTQGQGINGRFYWINPGETTINPLDFATAERAPDPITSVVVFGDQFWLPGVSTTEAWYFTGNADSPVARMQGVVFDRGAWEATTIQVKDSMIIVDDQGAVFQISGGAKRISRPDIEERIRKAMQRQAAIA
jgi:hypothetical protein